MLLLHGGQERSYRADGPRTLSSARMRPFARAIHGEGADHGVAVWSVSYRVRGWNDEDMSPVHDARWALEEVRRRHGAVPVVLVGHSMGGRTAVRVLDDASVVGMVGLAPWLPDEPAGLARDRRVLLAHGAADRVTDPDRTLAWAEAARPAARSVTYVRLRASGHLLLRRAGLWTDLAVGFSLASLGIEPAVGRVASRVLAAVAAGAGTLTV